MQTSGTEFGDVGRCCMVSVFVRWLGLFHRAQHSVAVVHEVMIEKGWEPKDAFVLELVLLPPPRANSTRSRGASNSWVLCPGPELSVSARPITITVARSYKLRNGPLPDK